MPPTHAPTTTPPTTIAADHDLHQGGKGCTG